METNELALNSLLALTMTRVQGKHLEPDFQSPYLIHAVHKMETLKMLRMILS